MLNVEIEARCGDCILTNEQCPMYKEWLCHQLVSYFYSQSKCYKEQCNYCLMYKNSKCQNYFFCSTAQEVMDYVNGNKKVDELSVGAVKSAIELGFIES